MREEIIVNSARLDYPRPPNERRHTEAALESSRLFAAIRRRSAIWPTHHLSPIVSRINYNRVIQDSKVLELLEQSTDHTVVLNHAVGIQAETGFAIRLWVKMRENMHPG